MSPCTPQALDTSPSCSVIQRLYPIRVLQSMTKSFTLQWITPILSPHHLSINTLHGLALNKTQTHSTKLPNTCLYIVRYIDRHRKYSKLYHVYEVDWEPPHLHMASQATSTLAQTSDDSNAVLHTAGQALQSGVDYYIKPAITDNGGRFTLINRNGSCPLFVGQENVSGPEGFPVTFSPLAEGETVVREGRDQKITFSASTTCVQSTAWNEGETDQDNQRRLIVTGEDENEGLPARAVNYFWIKKQATLDGVYNLEWCPTEVCPICKFICGSVGAIVENDKRLLALDGSVLPVVFERA